MFILSIANMSPSNRGMRTQAFIREVIERYNALGRSCIQEVDVPKTIGKNGAFYREKSTVDFVGIAYNRPVAFEVKSTRQRTRFDLSLVKEHQYRYLKSFHEQGGVAFILLEMIKHAEWFVIPFQKLKPAMERAWSGGKKSIPYFDLKAEMITVKEGGRTGLDFLEFIRSKKV
ncbi:Holliday junction resolvase RecU [Planifilum fimeticola]|uniref:Holliday junction resolvase RecU n=1 Tax=Planifilum fimeticola TaxID=201975 RepID=UPI000D064CCA|nr:Holliday junction resolvase RecU [Planifilum fimeticola]